MNSNLGIRAGGPSQIAFLDCDEKNHPGTYETAQAWLAGLGWLPGDYPVIQTASIIGRHIALRFTETLPGHSRIIKPDFGAGEFRFGPGSMVVAPPSQITDGGQYILIAGDYRQLPGLQTRDILPILSNPTTQASTRNRQGIPRKAFSLLHGKGLNRYKSRSEAEQALITILINAGHDFPNILALFQSYPCAGKFNELSQLSRNRAFSWLKRSYEEALAWCSRQQSQGRQLAEAALDFAASKPWPGRTGAVDQVVFIAHARIAFKSGQRIYAASSRTLAELAGITQPTASAATTRLIRNGLICLEKPGAFDYAAQYSLVQTLSLPKTFLCEEVIKNAHPHDTFRHRGLGKSAWQIYQKLLGGPQSPRELSQSLGRNIRTVKRNLKRMEAITDRKTGEVIAMVKETKPTWQAIPINLDQVARILGTYQQTELQIRKHTRERNQYRRTLDGFKEKKN